MKRSKVILSAALSSLFLISGTLSHAQTDTTEGKKLADQYITEATLHEHLNFIASDDLQGRDTPSPGLDTAAKYIADHVKSWGLKPMGGDGSYFQRINLSRRRVVVEKSVGSLGTTPLTYGNDFLSRSSGTGTATGGIVYAGHGYVFPSKGIDAYKGLDVRDKFIVVNGNMPTEIPFPDIAKMERGKDYLDPRLYGERNHAAGIIYLPAVDSPTAWASYRRAAERFGGGFSPAPKDNNPKSKFISVVASPALIDKLFSGEKTEGMILLKDKPVDTFAVATDKKLTLTVEIAQEEAITQNVVAVVEGSDSKLKKEYVAFGAHYDHVGVGRPDARGDSIYNGADDDGSGTVSLLALAEAFGKSKTKPKRSIIFVWHCGEEKGLWGSDYFTTYPTVPLTSIVTQLNIDMIGRSKFDGDNQEGDAELSTPNEIYTIGSRMLSTELGDIAERINKDYLSIAYNYRYDDPNDPNRFYYRSDHYNYARHGIPIIFWFDGVHVDYHRPSDEVSKIDFVKMSRVARTVFVTGVEIANRDKRPVVDKTSDR